MSRAIPALPLQEWYVISLRPLGLHDGIRRAATKLGAKTFALSTLAIESLDAGDTLRNALACPMVIATSPVAARMALSGQRLHVRPGQRWFAVGPGTAARLKRQGADDISIPTAGASAEALLKLPELAHLGGRKVGLVTAPGGRGQLAKVLAERGAQVVLAEVYRRVPRTPSLQRRRALAALPERSALLVSSVEALTGLWQALSESERRRLRRRPCVVGSQRLARQVRALGFLRPLVAASARPRDLLAALVDHTSAVRFR